MDELKIKLEKIMKQEFGITTDEQLNDAFENIDLSVFSIFTKKGASNEDN